jgi:hypothetical protein
MGRLRSLFTLPLLLTAIHPSSAAAQIHRAASAADSAGDAQPAAGWAKLLGKNYRSPDLVSVEATLDDSALTLTVRFAPGSFDPNRTLALIALDADGDSTTGTHSGNWPPGQDYSIQVGATAFHTATELTTFGNGVVTARDTIGPFTVLPDGYSLVLAPIASEQADKLRFYVMSQIALTEDGSTGVLDVIPGTAGGGEPKPSGWITLH